MLTISTMTQAEEVLKSFRPEVQALLGKNLTLVRMKPLLKLIGNPEQALRVIHVAGTSGKTSTSYYIAALLQAAGKTVGLTVSPHVDSITERIQVNSKQISEDDFCQALSEFLNIVEDCQPRPNYFELLMAFELWYFARSKVDFVVIETGLGGMYDCSNVCQRADKLCLITDIGFDHMRILGNTLPQIATQKAGIIHADNSVVMYEQGQAIDEVVQARASEVQAKLHTTIPLAVMKDLANVHELYDIPVFQRRNLGLATVAYKELALSGAVPALQNVFIEQALRTYIPGRMESRQVGTKTIIFDGAHNTQKMQTFVESLRLRHLGMKPAVLISAREKSDLTAILDLLMFAAKEIILTAFHDGSTSEKSDIRLQDMQKYCQDKDFTNVSVIPDHADAYKQLLEKADPVGVVTGSFFLVSSVRKLKI